MIVIITIVKTIYLVHLYNSCNCFSCMDNCSVLSRWMLVGHVVSGKAIDKENERECAEDTCTS